MAIPYNSVRDPQIDWLLWKTFIPASDVVTNVATQTAIFAPGTLSVGWSVGSPSYSQIPSSRIGGVVFAATSTQIDYFWRIPSSVDKRHPIYFRHHWTPQIGGATPTVSFNQWVATVSQGTAITVMSPTAPLNVQIPSSSNGAAAGTDGTISFNYNITGRGSIGILSTGLSAYQLMQDSVEGLHITVQPVSTNWAIKQNPLFWMGMDIEYTPRLTFGDGSRREARKMETNLGFGEIGATNAY